MAGHVITLGLCAGLYLAWGAALLGVERGAGLGALTRRAQPPLTGGTKTTSSPSRERRSSNVA